MRRPRRIAALAAMTAAAAFTAGAQPALAQPCDPSVATHVPQPSRAQLVAAGLGKLPLAPDSQRVDLVAPPFSRSTAVTNPLFPISDLHSAVITGHVDGKPLKIETTLLPATQVIEWSPGQCVRTLISQFVAYKGGRIEEVALDRYAQDDAGSVWYFGEDVFNYADGAVADTDGTWLAGIDGPAAMIMPAHPRVGNVNRAENVPGLVFEEVTTRAVNTTVRGPRGPVTGVIIGSELHDDGTREDKFFAPGYGEFRSAGSGDLEAMALAVPTDTLRGAMPKTLTTLYDGALNVYDAKTAKRRRAAARRTATAWKEHRKRAVPPRLRAPMSRAVRNLARTVRHGRRARAAALQTAQAALDLQLQYRTPTEIDRARLSLWARRVAVDAARRDAHGVNGDVSTMEWIRDRITQAVGPVALARIDRRIGQMRAAVTDGNLRAATRAANRLL
jgi:hypothetical protein